MEKGFNLPEKFKKISEERGKTRKKFKAETGASWALTKKESKIGKEAGFDALIESISLGKIISQEDILRESLSEKETLHQKLARLDHEAKEFHGRTYEEVSRELDALSKNEDAIIKQEYEILKSAKREGGVSAKNQSDLKKLSKIQSAIENRKFLLSENPKTDLAFRMHELSSYHKGLAENFAETPSRKKLMDWTTKKIEANQAVLLEGPTGTGKTELLIHLAKKLSGKLPEVVRSTERTGPSEIFGKMLLRKEDTSEATETYFQSGRYTTAIDEGKLLIFDEFNQLPTNMRFAMKELYNRKEGDEVTIQEDTGKSHIIKQGFGFAATANLKSKRYKERFEFDSAESRIFEMKRVDYIPKEELYDLMLSSLLDKHETAPISKESAEKTLKHLADAVEVIEEGYEGNLKSNFGRQNAKSGTPLLEKTVLDPGKIISIMKGYEISSARGIAFEEYLDGALFDFVSKGDYPESDRELLIRIFAVKGFFSDKTAKDFNIANLTDASLKALRGGKDSEKAIKGKAVEKRLTLRDIATLDPYGLRKIKAEKLADEFLNLLPEEEKVKTVSTEALSYQSFEYVSDPSNPSKIETINIDIETKINNFADFYETKHKINLPPDFVETAKEVWSRNFEEIKSEIEKYGYNQILIIPEDLPDLGELNEKMTEGYRNKTYQSNNFKLGGSFAGIKNTGKQKFRIVLVHDAQNLADNPILKETKGKSVVDLSGLSKKEVEERIKKGKEIPINFKLKDGRTLQAGGLSVAEYEIFQRVYFEEKAKHLNQEDWSWLMGSFSGSRVAGAGWDPGDGQVILSVGDPGDQNDDLGVRPSRSFI